MRQDASLRSIIAVFGIFALGALPTWGAGLVVKALDPQGRVLEGIRFAFGGVESLPTTEAGVTELTVPGVAAGEALKLDLPRHLAEDWLLVDTVVHSPAGAQDGPAEVVLVRREDLHRLASRARDTVDRTMDAEDPHLARQRRRTILDLARKQGLSEAQLDRAIRALGASSKEMDRGIAAYLDGEHGAAEVALERAASRQEADLVEALRYLGASRFALAKYEAAAESFRRALALKDGEPELVAWLAKPLYELARFEELEILLRDALKAEESKYGPDHPFVGRTLNNLALVLHDTDRVEE
ncbi:MAG: tetratricopeptide repeat protein, partial [Acidobacteriota bacterium]